MFIRAGCRVHSRSFGRDLWVVGYIRVRLVPSDAPQRLSASLLRVPRVVGFIGFRFPSLGHARRSHIQVPGGQRVQSGLFGRALCVVRFFRLLSVHLGAPASRWIHSRSFGSFRRAPGVVGIIRCVYITQGRSRVSRV